MSGTSKTSWQPGRRRFPDAVRKAILRRDPICRCTDRCPHHVGGPCTSPSTVADHVVPVFEGGSDELTNGAGMCVPCHTRKTGKESGRARARISASRFRSAEPHPGRVRRPDGGGGR